MEEEKLRAVYYARCSTEEENQKDALVRQAAEAEEAIRARGWRLVDAYVGEPLRYEPEGQMGI